MVVDFLMFKNIWPPRWVSRDVQVTEELVRSSEGLFKNKPFDFFFF